MTVSNYIHELKIIVCNPESSKQRTYQWVSTIDQPTFFQGTFKHPTLPNIKTVASEYELRSTIYLQYEKSNCNLRSTYNKLKQFYYNHIGLGLAQRFQFHGF